MHTGCEVHCSHEPGAEWSIDLAGPSSFPADKHGSTYICVAVDSLSRFVMAKAIKSTKAEETAQFILEITRCNFWSALEHPIGQCQGAFLERALDCAFANQCVW
jgi:hypothetical protein